MIAVPIYPLPILHVCCWLLVTVTFVRLRFILFLFHAVATVTFICVYFVLWLHFDRYVAVVVYVAVVTLVYAHTRTLRAVVGYYVYGLVGCYVALLPFTVATFTVDLGSRTFTLVGLVCGLVPLRYFVPVITFTVVRLFPVGWLLRLLVVARLRPHCPVGLPLRLPTRLHLPTFTRSLPHTHTPFHTLLCHCRYVGLHVWVTPR